MPARAIAAATDTAHARAGTPPPPGHTALNHMQAHIVGDQEHEIISDCDCDPDVEVISYIAEQDEEKAMLAAAEHMEYIVHDFMCFSDKAWLVPSWRQRLYALGLSPRFADAFIGQASEEAVLRCTGCQTALGEKQVGTAQAVFLLGSEVVLLEDFKSHYYAEPIVLRAGCRGKVVQIDHDGDFLILFSAGMAWVLKGKACKVLELTRGDG